MNRNQAIDICAKFLSQNKIEGFATAIDGGRKAQAYWDKKGEKWTIGYGSTFYKDGSAVKEGDVITKQEAIDLMRWFISEVDKVIYPYIKVPLNDNQYAALLSLGYNWGPGRVKNSDVLKAINSRDNSAVISGIWITTGITAKGIVVPALITRRGLEIDLYTSGAAISKAKTAVLIAGILLISYGIYKLVK